LRPYLEKKTSQKKDWWSGGVAQGEGPEFKPQHCKKKKTVSDMETPGPKVAQEVKYFAPQIDGKEEPRPKRAGCVTRVIQQAQIQFQ
jgi:hypothetical protein